jgi:hypothetical protein
MQIFTDVALRSRDDVDDVFSANGAVVIAEPAATPLGIESALSKR